MSSAAQVNAPSDLGGTRKPQRHHRREVESLIAALEENETLERDDIARHLGPARTRAGAAAAAAAE